MEVYYLEFLKELSYCLDQYEESWWSNWMNKSIVLYEQNKDLSHFFSAFGGNSSFNDNSFSDIINVLTNITYGLACVLRDEKDTNVTAIMNKEKERYESLKENQYLSDSEEKELKYLNYLLDNYELSNLQKITEHYKTSRSIRKTK